MLEGKVIGRCMQRDRHQESSDSSMRSKPRSGRQARPRDPRRITVASKHPKVRAGLDRHPRFVFHFTPTSCSWLNAVEGFFAKLSGDGSKVVCSVPSSISRPPSIASSASTTPPTPSPSPGKPILRTSSRLETEGSKRCNQSTRSTNGCACFERLHLNSADGWRPAGER